MTGCRPDDCRSLRPPLRRRWDSGLQRKRRRSRDARRLSERQFSIGAMTSCGPDDCRSLRPPLRRRWDSGLQRKRRRSRDGRRLSERQFSIGAMTSCRPDDCRSLRPPLRRRWVSALQRKRRRSRDARRLSERQFSSVVDVFGAEVRPGSEREHDEIAELNDESAGHVSPEDRVAEKVDKGQPMSSR